LRIVQLVADGKPGGGTTVVLELIRALRHEPGIDLALISEPGSYALDEARALGVPTAPLDLWRGRLDPAAPAALRRALAELAGDLVHAHGARAGLALARLRRPPRYVYTVHGYHFPRKTWPVRLAGAAAEALIHARATASIWVSAHDRLTARAWRLDRARPLDRVIVNGIDFTRLPERSPPDPDLIGFLGRLHPQKNPLLLAEILALLPPPLRLRVIGGGALERDLRARAEALGCADRLEITGALPRDQALRALGGCTALLLPSAWEAVPVALVEAMHQGIVPIAAAVGGIPELVEPERSGVLIEGHAPAAYAAAVLALRADPSRCRRLADAAVLRARQVYALDRMVRAHRELYASLAVAGRWTSCRGAAL
jgi:glycosyltransferase involved in cell wall biosynthesis